MLRAVAVTIDSIMKPVFGTPTGTGVAPTGAIATQTPIANTFGNSGLRWCLSTMTKPRGIGELLDAANGADAAKRRQHHRIGERQFVGLADRAVVGDLLDGHLAGLDALHAGVGDPLDVLLAHLAFEQALGVADPVETEMADIGFGGDERHRHAVAQLAAAQLGFQDEQEFVGRAEAGCALHGADHDGPGIGGQLFEGLPSRRRRDRRGRSTGCGRPARARESRRMRAPVRWR